MSMRDRVRGRATHRKVGAPSSKIIIFLVLILAGLLGGGIALYVRAQGALVRIDPKSLCPTDRPPSEVVVLLLDMSDEFSERQRLKVRNEFDRLRDSIVPFGLIEAYAVDRLDQRVTTPEVHLCNPGFGADLNKLYQNPDLARKKWEGFVRQLDDELGRLMKMPSSQTSAIFEAVQATALRTFNQQRYDGIPKRLVIVSDLMQNVPGKLSHYQAIVPFDTFRASAYFAEVRADLTGIAVTLLYLVRPQSRPKWPDHYRFWEQYFLAQGATVQKLEPVWGP